ncbi:MAG: CPBP family intramembrane metalloprotease [Kiritimatiellaeota bacterium]|nr:CPBP family intramembrane metalloprotease [Kiritimatiellota bacterium]
MQSVIFDWAGLAAIAALLARRRLSWRSAFGLEPRGFFRHLGLGLLFYLATMPFFWFYGAIYQLGLKRLGLDPTLQEVALAITAVESLGVRIYLITLAVVIAPVFEELLFRGILLPAAARQYGVGWGVILTSLAFAAIHLHLMSFAPLFLMAVAFALAYLYSESILVPVVMHGVFNAVNLGLLTMLRDAL